VAITCHVRHGYGRMVVVVSVVGVLTKVVLRVTLWSGRRVSFPVSSTVRRDSTNLRRGEYACADDLMMFGGEDERCVFSRQKDEGGRWECFEIHLFV